MRDLQAGVYRHYKGHLYLVLGYATDANQTNRTVVVYVGLQMDGAATGQRMHIRTAEDFFATIDPSTGTVLDGSWDGTYPAPIERFTYLGPTVTVSNPATED